MHFGARCVSKTDLLRRCAVLASTCPLGFAGGISAFTDASESLAESNFGARASRAGFSPRRFAKT
jgi:hypothetical protein